LCKSADVQRAAHIIGTTPAVQKHTPYSGLTVLAPLAIVARAVTKLESLKCVHTKTETGIDQDQDTDAVATSRLKLKPK